MKAHFVTFYSPGTIVAEETTRKIASWDVGKAVEMSGCICERHGASPYGFRFTTRSRGDDELDSKETARSPFYFLGGRVRTVEDIEAEHDPKNAILLSNMRGNGYARVVDNRNSWRSVLPLRDGDIVLDVSPAACEDEEKR